MTILLIRYFNLLYMLHRSSHYAFMKYCISYCWITLHNNRI